MKLSSFHALLVAAASLVAYTSADFKVTPERTVKTATSKNVNYVKQWTLSPGARTDVISSIDLSLSGNAYVSYVKGLPAGVMGYVNVSGSSRDVVNAVTVSKDVLKNIDNDLDDLFDNDNDNDGGELNVWISPKATSGYLLTEIFLASPDAVTELQSQRSAQVVVEDGVLAVEGKHTEVQIDATGSSIVYVSAPKADVSVKELSLESTGSASIEYNVNSLDARTKLKVDAEDSSSITVLADTVETSKLELKAEPEGSICISAEKVAATVPKIEGNKQISLPNADKTYGASGKDVCEEATLPGRKAGKITGVYAGLMDLLDGDDNDNDDANDSTEN